MNDKHMCEVFDTEEMKDLTLRYNEFYCRRCGNIVPYSQIDKEVLRRAKR